MCSEFVLSVSCPEVRPPCLLVAIAEVREGNDLRLLHRLSSPGAGTFCVLVRHGRRLSLPDAGGAASDFGRKFGSVGAGNSSFVLIGVEFLIGFAETFLASAGSSAVAGTTCEVSSTTWKLASESLSPSSSVASESLDPSSNVAAGDIDVGDAARFLVEAFGSVVLFTSAGSGSADRYFQILPSADVKGTPAGGSNQE